MTSGVASMDRRRFNLAAALIVGTPLSWSVAAEVLRTDARSTGSPLHFVYDTRVAGGNVSGLLQVGVFDQCHLFSGDISPLWFNTLDRFWTGKGVRIMGMTRHSELFVLSILARDRGYAISEKSESRDQVIWLLEPRQGRI